MVGGPLELLGDVFVCHCFGVAGPHAGCPQRDQPGVASAGIAFGIGDLIGVAVDRCAELAKAIGPSGPSIR